MSASPRRSHRLMWRWTGANACALRGGFVPHCCLVALLSGFLLTAGAAESASGPDGDPYSAASRDEQLFGLDRLVAGNAVRQRIPLAAPCSDAVFIRRATMVAAGRLPTMHEVLEFLEDNRPGKRAALVDRLLAGEDHALLTAMRWCDALRVKSEFPVNLWPNAVQAYHRWVFEAVRSNMRHDAFARALVTSSGSNFRVPPVNFLRAVPEKSPEGIGRVVALTFFGSRWESLDAGTRSRMEAAFAGVGYKPTAEWKEEVVFGGVADQEMTLDLPDGSQAVVARGADPRGAFADWMTSRDNAAFAQAGANRVWAWLFGRGIVHEPDDMRADNPPAVPELLEFLGREFAASGYDLRALHRLIMNSATFSQSCVPAGPSAEAERIFACYPVHPVEAEVLIDALCQLTGDPESYMSAIPEPFTYVTDTRRTVALADASISSSFLDLFGRPARDTGRFSERGAAASDEQLRYLLNSRHIQRKIERGEVLRALAREAKSSEDLVERLYLHILSRPPTQDEETAALGHFATAANPREGANDLAWALINSKEFLFHH